MPTDLTTSMLFEVTGASHDEVLAAIDKTIENYVGDDKRPAEVEIDVRPEIVSGKGDVARWSAWCTVRWQVRT